MGIYENHIFPAIMDVALAGVKEDRRELIGQASGMTLELGMGSGANLPYYTKAVTRVVGLEPCAEVVETAKRRLAVLAAEGALQAAVGSFEFHVGGGERLPFANSEFDTVIACLVFCTIADAKAAATEMYRVLKPGGRLLFYEHVCSPDARMSRIQRVVNPFWKVFACGCQLNRDTETLFLETGFEYQTIRRYRNARMSPPFAAWMIQGEAMKAGS
jgi:ubiquinone/menaquinone biosynthesis C-methylase UbiE